MKFASPLFLLLLLIPAIYVFLKYRKKGMPGNIRMDPTLLFSSNRILAGNPSLLAKLYHPVSDFLITGTIVFMIIALARPLGGRSVSTEKYFGVDIVLSIDVSGSMLNVDTIPSGLPYREIFGRRIYIDSQRSLIPMNRINSAKKVIMDYVKKQEFNRIGIVVFAGYSYTKCPLTLDKEMLMKILGELNFNPENERTAIGMGIATSINRLKRSDAKSKAIILLTDGKNNSGMIDPITAAQIARDLNIRIYTIGLGNPDGFLQPASVDFINYEVQIGAGLDEAILQNIADTTGGKFYRAYDPDSLRKIYDDIDKLEKSKIEIKRRVLYKENFNPYLITGLILLISYISFTAVVTKLP